MAIDVEVLDLGINNLASLRRGLTEAGASNLRIVASASEAKGADLMVMPGVGNYGAAVVELEQRGLRDVVERHVASGGCLFGVCLGMQLLSDGSEESPGAAGLGLIPGQVRKLAGGPGVRVPNMGWNSLEAHDPDGLFPALDRNLDFYFVHSYAVVPDDDAHTLATSPFGDTDFVASVLRDNVLGTQFHPEKSSRAGKQLLVDVLEWANG